MAASSFSAALHHVLAHEGGYSNHPADPGGPTMKGIIQRVYDADRRARNLPPRPVREIAQSELVAIYRRQYWTAIAGDALPAGIDYVVFDCAVNSGPVQAAKWLQRALGIAADGQVGAVTRAAAAAAVAQGRRAVVVDAICARRLAMLRSLRTWPVFGTGWARRVEEVRRRARVWGETPTDPSPPDVSPEADRPSGLSGAGGKAPVSSAGSLPGGGGALGAAAGGVLASAFGEAARQIAPLAPGSHTLSLLFTGLTLAGLLLTCAGLVLVWGRGRARDRLETLLDLRPTDAGAPGEQP